jgi:hypothetical protein
MDFIAADPEMRLHRYDSKQAHAQATVHDAPSTPSDTPGGEQYPHSHTGHGEKAYPVGNAGGSRVDA